MYNKIKNYDIASLEGILAYRYISNANITE